jgi:hypothetical protein
MVIAAGTTQRTPPVELISINGPLMPEDAKDRGHRNRDRIDISQDQECRYWSEKLGVSSDKIRDAVKQVGPMAKDVEHHLRDDAEVSRSA